MNLQIARQSFWSEFQLPSLCSAYSHVYGELTGQLPVGRLIEDDLIRVCLSATCGSHLLVPSLAMFPK